MFVSCFIIDVKTMVFAYFVLVNSCLVFSGHSYQVVLSF